MIVEEETGWYRFYAKCVKEGCDFKWVHRTTRFQAEDDLSEHSHDIHPI